MRNHWHHHQHYGWFTSSWWAGHHHGLCGWHYYRRYPSYSWNYWWTVPTFAAVTNWFTWSAPATVWSQPVYYDYGPQGNVTYESNNVYINGQQIASSQEFAASAAQLATVAPPKDETEAAAAEWLPLGTFALATDEKDVEPTRVVQLAVDKQGIVSGTLYNTQTDKAQTIQGQVDKQTQRVALRVGESEEVVMETGLYNLTQDEAPVLVHFGPDKTETYLLVRLEAPPEAEETSTEP
jgi:hypothetical protein